MFFPTIARVPVGTAVRFLNTGQVPHNVTGVAGTWESGDLAEGAEYRHAFSAPGVYPFACTLHPGMNGAIVVGGDAPVPAAPAMTSTSAQIAATETAGVGEVSASRGRGSCGPWHRCDRLPARSLPGDADTIALNERPSGARPLGYTPPRYPVCILAMHQPVRPEVPLVLGRVAARRRPARPAHRHRAARPQGPRARRVRRDLDVAEPAARLPDRAGPRRGPDRRGHRRQPVPRLRGRASRSTRPATRTRRSWPRSRSRPRS